MKTSSPNPSHWTVEDIVASENPRCQLGLDGLPYMVFNDSYLSWEYAELVFGVGFTGRIACLGNYENAVLLQKYIGL